MTLTFPEGHSLIESMFSAYKALDEENFNNGIKEHPKVILLNRVMYEKFVFHCMQSSGYRGNSQGPEFLGAKVRAGYPLEVNTIEIY